MGVVDWIAADVYHLPVLIYQAVRLPTFMHERRQPPAQQRVAFRRRVRVESRSAGGEHQRAPYPVSHGRPPPGRLVGVRARARRQPSAAGSYRSIRTRTQVRCLHRGSGVGVRICPVNVRSLAPYAYGTLTTCGYNAFAVNFSEWGHGGWESQLGGVNPDHSATHKRARGVVNRSIAAVGAPTTSMLG